MFHVWSGWRSGMSIFSIPLSWYKSVTQFLNNFSQGRGIEIEKPDNPDGDAPVRIKLSGEVLEALDGVNKLLNTQAPPGVNEIPSGYMQSSNPGSKDSTSFIASNVNDPGVVLDVLCRAATNGADCVLHFRQLTITADGRIQRVSGETDAVAVFEAT